MPVGVACLLVSGRWVEPLHSPPPPLSLLLLLWGFMHLTSYVDPGDQSRVLGLMQQVLCLTNCLPECLAQSPHHELP